MDTVRVGWAEEPAAVCRAVWALRSLQANELGMVVAWIELASLR